MSDDRKEYFIKKNQIMEEFHMQKVEYRIKHMFEKKEKDVIY